MPKCFIYCRQSAGDEDFSESCESQKDALTTLAKKLDLTVIDVFMDLNVSGKTYEEGAENIASMDVAYQSWFNQQTHLKMFRKGLGCLMKRLNEVDYILVWDLTRFYRPVTGSFLEAHLNQLLIIHNVKVMTLEGTIDFNDFNNSLISAIQNRINDNQIKIQKEKSMASMKRLKDNGEWSGECFKSFGYKSTGRRREVEIDPIKAEIVKTVYSMYMQGKKYFTIAKIVNGDLYRKTGLTLFKTHMIRILKNPIYAGYYKDSHGDLIKAKPIIGKELITLEDWMKVQKIFSEQKKHPRRAYKNWLPLRGKIFCGKCGEHINATTTNKVHVDYRCMSYSKHGLGPTHSCKCSIGWQTWEEGAAGLKDAIYPLSSLFFIDKESKAKNEHTTELDEIRIELKNVETKEEKLNGLFMDDLIDDTKFRQNMKVLKAKKDSLIQRMTEMDIKKDSDYDMNKFLEDMSMCNAKCLDEGVATEALRYAIDKITLYEDHAVIATIKGGFMLPIRRWGHSKCLPRVDGIYFTPDDENWEMWLIYHYGKVELNPDDPGRLLADLGKVKIYFR